jgi:hypothetical protein
MAWKPSVSSSVDFDKCRRAAWQVLTSRQIKWLEFLLQALTFCTNSTVLNRLGKHATDRRVAPDARIKRQWL